MEKHEQKSSFAFTGLSARLLLLTAVSIMVAEAMIWTPSISRFRKVYLEEHIVRAQLATLALEALPDKSLSKQLADELLFYAEAYVIVLQHLDRRVLMVSKSMPPKVDLTVDISQGTFFGWIEDAFDTMRQEQNRVLRVVGKSEKDPNVMIEIIIDETPMREAMYEFSKRILQLSVGISLFAASLVYLALNLLMIRPMRRITGSITAFRRAPEDALRELKPSGRRDEIGITERELARMQDEVRQALAQQSRLATLGAGMAKINHDLRNSLATAVLAFDRLALVDDPEVKRTLPRLYNAIDKAVNLCSQTLKYVGNGMPEIHISKFHLYDLIDEVGVQLSEPLEEDFVEQPSAELVWKNRIPTEVEIVGDREQLFRVFSNLGRNAFEAGATHLTVTSHVSTQKIEIHLADNGPGFLEIEKKQLFKPFAGSTKEKGTGLGLVIVRDIMKAHGGDIELLDQEEGTTFLISMPMGR